MSFVTIPLDGGLDLKTAPQAVTPGKLVDCLNYEIAYQKGYKRIDGYEAFDGNPSTSITSVYVWTAVGTQTGNIPNHGTLIAGTVFAIFNPTHILNGVSLSYTTSYNAGTNITTQTLKFYLQNVPQSLLSGSTVTQVGNATDFIPSPTVTYGLEANTTSQYNTDIAAYANTVSSQKQVVPGQGPVNGVFWLKDTLYATRDYLAIPFTNGNAQPNIGDTIYIGPNILAATWWARIAKITVTSGTWSGISGGNAAGVLLVFSQNGVLSSASVNNPSSGANNVLTVSTASATSTAAGLYQAVGGTYGPQGVIVGNDYNNWKWCDLGWNVGISASQNAASSGIDMNLALTPFQQLYQSGSPNAIPMVTTWHTASTGSANGWQISGASGFPGVIDVAGDSQYAYHYYYDGTNSFPSSGIMRIGGFGFTINDIPPGSVITGIEIQIVDGAVQISGGATAKPIDTTLYLNGVASGNQPNIASSLTYSTSITTTPVNLVQPFMPWATRVYGLEDSSGKYPTDLLGYDQITAKDIINSNFGISYGVGLFGPQTTQQIQFGIDLIQMRFAYRPQNNIVYFWNANSPSPLSVLARVVMHYDQNGKVGNTDIYGVNGTMYFQFIQSNGTIGGVPNRPIQAGEQIRKWGGGRTPDGGVADGSILIYTTTNNATMNFMDSSGQMQGQYQPDGTLSSPSKYQSVTKNFYASSGTEAIYGVSGGGPAFYFDGVKSDTAGNTVVGNFTRILTGLDGAFETPRSICAHQGHIVLGYGSGLYQWSNAANVLSFNPTLYDQTAKADSVGEVCTGVLSVSADALLVAGRLGLYVVQGNLSVPNSLYKQTISPYSGAIEYTLDPILGAIFCDFRGVTSLMGASAYGSFEMDHLSDLVSPWIIPRVQLSAAYEVNQKGPINSLTIRNKNQYRLLFADGYQLTATFIDDKEMPQWTIQQYTYGAAGGNTPIPWAVAEVFTHSAGQDRIFVAAGATSLYPNGDGFVYELDRGRGFNSTQPINAHFTMVPDFSEAPFQNKKFAAINIFGDAQDYATFNLSRSPNYTIPQQATGNNVITETFGNASSVPTGIQSPYVSYGTSGLVIEGTAINLRIDSSTATQATHTIQAISYDVTPLQGKAQ